MSCSRHSSAMLRSPRQLAITSSSFCWGVNFRYLRVSLNVISYSLSGRSSDQPRTEPRRLRRLASPIKEINQKLSTPSRGAGHAAHQTVRDRSNELAELERQRASEAVPDNKVRAVEKALAAARARAGEPWAERIAGAREAARQADDAAKRHATTHYEELAQELRAEAEAAAARVDAAMADVLAARSEHTAVSARASALVVGAGGRNSYGMVPASRIDGVAREIDSVMLQHGGERAPAPPDSIRPPYAEEVMA